MSYYHNKPHVPYELRRALERAKHQGRYGDTMLAHINPEEAELLKEHGGSGTINPHTGLPEFGLGKAFRKITKPIGNALGIKTSKTDPETGYKVKTGVGKVLQRAPAVIGSAVGSYFGGPVGSVIGGSIGGSMSRGKGNKLKGAGEGAGIGAAYATLAPMAGGAMGINATSGLGQTLSMNSPSLLHQLGMTSAPSIGGGIGLWGNDGNLGLVQGAGQGTDEIKSISDLFGGDSSLAGSVKELPKMGLMQYGPLALAGLGAGLSLFGREKYVDPITGERAQHNHEGFGKYFEGPKDYFEVVEPGEEENYIDEYGRVLVKHKKPRFDHRRRYAAGGHVDPVLKQKDRYQAHFGTDASQNNMVKSYHKSTQPKTKLKNPKFERIRNYKSGSCVDPVLKQKDRYQAHFGTDASQNNMVKSYHKPSQTIKKYARGGYIDGSSGGQHDDVYADIPHGSYVMDATTVSLLGDGNSKHGAQKLQELENKLASKSQMMKDFLGSNIVRKGQDGHHEYTKKANYKRGGERLEVIPAKVSDGEYILSPETVSMLGGGNIEVGAKKLDSFRKSLRKDKGVKTFLPPKTKNLSHYLGK